MIIINFIINHPGHYTAKLVNNSLYALLIPIIQLLIE